MNFPAEIIMLIASYVSRNDLCNFRLSHSIIAAVCSPFLVRNGVSVLYSAPYLDELRHFLQWRKVEADVMELTLYFGTWPVCLRPTDWKEHRLHFDSRASTRKLLKKANGSFQRYSAFITQQQNCPASDDVDAMSRILVLLPNLRTVTITDMKDSAKRPFAIRRFCRLLPRTQKAPCPSLELAPAIERFLVAYGRAHLHVGNPKFLHIKGHFNPALISPDIAKLQFPKIEGLAISTKRPIDDGDEAVRNFLSLFPGLHHLTLEFKRNNTLYELTGQPPIDGLLEHFIRPQLRTCKLDGLCMSEDILFEIIYKHHRTLQSVLLGHVTLTSGSWSSLFARAKDLDIEIKIELYGTLSDQYLIYVG